MLFVYSRMSPRKKLGAEEPGDGSCRCRNMPGPMANVADVTRHFQSIKSVLLSISASFNQISDSLINNCLGVTWHCLG